MPEYRWRGWLTFCHPWLTLCLWPLLPRRCNRFCHLRRYWGRMCRYQKSQTDCLWEMQSRHTDLFCRMISSVFPQTHLPNYYRVSWRYQDRLSPPWPLARLWSIAQPCWPCRRTSLRTYLPTCREPCLWVLDSRPSSWSYRLCLPYSQTCSYSQEPYW